MRMLIEVTQEDIENGQPTVCRKCPIARATKRAFGKRDPVYDIAVDTEDILVILNNAEYRCKPTPEMVDFINMFDCMEEVKPFSVELEFRELKY